MQILFRKQADKQKQLGSSITNKSRYSLHYLSILPVVGAEDFHSYSELCRITKSYEKYKPRRKKNL